MEARRASLLGSLVTTSAYGDFLTSKLVANLTMLAPGPPLDTDWLVSALSRDTEVPIAAIRNCWIDTFERNRQRHFGPKKSESPNLPILLKS